MKSITLQIKSQLPTKLLIKEFRSLRRFLEVKRIESAINTVKKFLPNVYSKHSEKNENISKSEIF